MEHGLASAARALPAASSEDDNQENDSQQSEMDIASLSGLGDQVNTDLANVAWPSDAPSLESLEQLIVH